MNRLSVRTLNIKKKNFLKFKRQENLSMIIFLRKFQLPNGATGTNSQEAKCSEIRIFGLTLAIHHHIKWMPTSLSELTPIKFDIELTHLGSKASIYTGNIITDFLL